MLMCRASSRHSKHPEVPSRHWSFVGLCSQKGSFLGSRQHPQQCHWRRAGSWLVSIVVSFAKRLSSLPWALSFSSSARRFRRSRPSWWPWRTCEGCVGPPSCLCEYDDASRARNTRFVVPSFTSAASSSERNFGGVPFESLMWGSCLISDKTKVANQALESQICWGLPTFKLPPRSFKVQRTSTCAARHYDQTCITVSPETGRSSASNIAIPPNNFYQSFDSPTK